MTIASRGRGRRAARCLCLLAAGLAIAGQVSAQAPGPSPATAGVRPAADALDAGDAEEAERLATAYLASHPGDIAAQLIVVRARIARDAWDEAYEAAREAVRTHERDVAAHYLLGFVTRQLAGAAFDRVVAMAPAGARAHQLRAEVFEAQDRRADAEREYAAALAVEPTLVEALLGLAKLQRIRLACPEALALYRRAEASRPTFEGAYGLGVCHAQLDQDEEAIAAFERAIARNPGSAVAWTWLGQSLVKLGRVQPGIDALERAVAIEPAMAEAHYALGMAYRKSGDAARSRAAFAEVERLRARSPR